MKAWKELLVGGLWAASAVQMAAYTWEAFGSTGGWSVFPGLPGTSTPTTSVAAKAAGKEDGGVVVKTRAGVSDVFKTITSPLKHVPILGSVLGSVGNAINGAPGGLTNAQIKRLNSLPNPPSNLVTKLQKASQGSQQQVAAANALMTWAQSHGWRSGDVINYLKYINVNVMGN